MPNIYIYSNYLTYHMFHRDRRFTEYYDGRMRLKRATSDAVNEDVRAQFDALMQLAISDSGALNVSRAVYQKLSFVTTVPSQIQQFSEAEVDFLTALTCDVEVALQAKRLETAVDYLENDGVVFESDSRGMEPPLNYLDSDHLSLADQEVLNTISSNLVEHSVYVINTHGRAQALDGSYEQAVYHSDTTISRIVVDACASASNNFPVKRGGSMVRKGGNDSVVDLVLDALIKTKKPNHFEVLGYLNKFTSELPDTLHAIFSKTPKFDANGKALINQLRLRTVSDRKAELENRGDNRNKQVIASKARQFAAAAENSDGESVAVLKGSIKDVLSKVVGDLLVKSKVVGVEETSSDIVKLKEIFNLLDETRAQASLALLEALRTSNGRDLNRKKAELKKLRNSWIDKMTDEAALQELGHHVLNLTEIDGELQLNEDNTDTMTSLDTLKAALNLEMSPTSVLSAARDITLFGGQKEEAVENLNQTFLLSISD